MTKKLLTLILTVMVIVGITVMPAAAAPAGSWLTDFTLFNLSGSPAGIKIVRYGMYAGGAADTGTVIQETTIPENGSFYYNPGDPKNTAAFPSSFSGSIVVESSQQLAGTVTVANSFSGRAYASDAYSAVGVPTDTQYLPIIMGKYGSWNTRISIQNAGDVAAKVTVTYSGAGAPAPEIISNLPANQTVQVDNYTTAGMNNFNGSATVTAVAQSDGTTKVPVAVVVEEYRTIGGMLVMYNGMPTADTTVYLPGYIDQASWGTDFTIVNTEGAQANVKITFSGLDASYTLTGPVPATGSVYLNRSLPTGWAGKFPDNYYGAATITSDKKVVIAYNIANTARGGASNLGIGYLGFPASDAATTITVPLIENLYSTGWATTFSVQSVDGTPANLSLKYSGNLAPLCNPCTYSMKTGESSHTFNQLYDGHLPKNFIGGVTITSDKPIVVIADQNNGVSSTYAAGDAAAGFVGFK